MGRFIRTVMPWNDVLRPTQSAIASSLYNHKVLLYTLVSSIAVTTIIANALKRHSNFYSLAIYLSKSNRSVIVRQPIVAVTSQLTYLIQDSGQLRYPHSTAMWSGCAAHILRSLATSGNRSKPPYSFANEFVTSKKYSASMIAFGSS